MKVLIIGECTPLSSGIMDSNDYVLREIYTCDRSAVLLFRGLQLTFSGDLFQLKAIQQDDVSGEDNRQCFYSKAWYLTFGTLGSGITVVLNNNYHQKSDPPFLTSGAISHGFSNR